MPQVRRRPNGMTLALAIKNVASVLFTASLILGFAFMFASPQTEQKPETCFRQITRNYHGKYSDADLQDTRNFHRLPCDLYR